MSRTTRPTKPLTAQVQVRLDVGLLRQLDDRVRLIRAREPAMRVTRASVLRSLAIREFAQEVHGE